MAAAWLRPPSHRAFCTSGPSDTKASDAKASDTKASDTSEEEPAAEKCADTEAFEQVEDGPCVLFEALPLTSNFQEAEHQIGVAAIAAGGGIGAAMLGVAHLVAPTPFMFGLLIAAVQVRIAHAWQTRQLRAQVRRNVTEVTLSERGAALAIKMDGGVTRHLRLTDTDDDGDGVKLSEVFDESVLFYLDREASSTKSPASLDEVLASSRRIQKEDLKIKTFENESHNEALKVVPRIDKLTPKDLADLAKAKSGSPRAEMDKVVFSAQAVAGAVVTGGTVLFMSGRLDMI